MSGWWNIIIDYMVMDAGINMPAVLKVVHFKVIISLAHVLHLKYEGSSGAEVYCEGHLECCHP